MPPRRPSVLRPSLILAVAAAAPALLMSAGVIHVPVVAETISFGLAILGAAFLLSWAAEVAQMDISQTLAIAVLAFIAVLPEYAVDLFLAFRAGQGDVAKQDLAIANMTGANRLLIGIGWAVVVLIFFFKTKQRKVVLRPAQRIDVGFLLVATLWAFTIPIRGSLSLIDFVVLGALFTAYVLRAAGEPVEEPELIGAAAALGSLSKAPRRVVTILLFVFAAAVILVVAEPFADGLIEIGTSFADTPEQAKELEFLLIQWVAPLASETPEMIIAILFTLRLKAQAGLGTLISSKVNQWTLLVGTLPLVFALAGGGRGGDFFTPMAMDARQVEEVFLTAAQSLFAVAVIASLSISRMEALGLLALFFGQFFFPVSSVRWAFAIVYIVLAVGLFVISRETRVNLWDSIVHVFRPGRRRR